MKIRIGIAGYGNLGRGVECAVHHAPDLELVALLTRRNPASIKTHTGVPVYRMSDAAKLRDQIDVMILCGGSANDLPEQTPEAETEAPAAPAAEAPADADSDPSPTDEVAAKAAELSRDIEKQLNRLLGKMRTRRSRSDTPEAPETETEADTNSEQT